MRPIPQINVDRIPEVANRILSRYVIEPEQFSDTADQVSMLGTPVYSNLQFKMVSGTSLDNSRAVGGQGSDSEVILRIDSCIISVSLVNNIVVTPIQGRRPVIEYIGNDNYMITVQGEIISEYSNQFPIDDLSLLVELCNLGKALPVASNFLNVFSIDSVVVERADFFEKVGSRNAVPFQLQCISDYPIEFKLNATS